MLPNHYKEIENVRKGIFLPPGITDSKRMFFINGLFGVGKSRFVNKLADELLGKEVADAVCFFEGSEKINFLPEITHRLYRSFKINDNIKQSINIPVNEDSECVYNLQQFAEILNILHETSIEFWKKITFNSLLISESDYILSNKKYNYESIQDDELVQFIDKKGDRRLLTETPKVIAEAFIVDLMKIFYPSDEIGESFERHYSGNEPKKIVLFFDNFESIDFSLNTWLSKELITYCCEKKFSDFISYQISYIDNETKVSNFFDFRFILSSRENYLVKPDFDYEWEKHRDTISEIRINPIERENLKDFFDSYEVRIDKPSLEIMQITYGIPCLLTEYLDNFENADSVDIELTINKKAIQSIGKLMTAEQFDWLRFTCFLDEFDENAFRCFLNPGSDFKRIFLFSRNTTALTDEFSDNDGKIIINDLIKKIVKLDTEKSYPELADDYPKRAEIYYENLSVFNQLKDNEIDVVRSFAYFNCFDDEYAIENTFQSDSHIAKEFLNSHPDWFVSNKTTKSLKKEYSEKLMRLNELVDGEKFKLKKEMVKKAWTDYSTELNSKLSDYDSELSSAYDSSSEIQDVSRSLKHEYDKLQEEFFATENALIIMRRESTAFTKKNNVLSGVICLFLSVMLGMLTNYFPEIFQLMHGDNKELYNILYMVTYTFAILFGILTIVYLVKEMTLRMRRNEYYQLKSDITESEVENKIRQESMKANKDKRNALESQGEEKNLRKRILSDEIESIKLKLSEPFI